MIQTEGKLYQMIQVGLKNKNGFIVHIKKAKKMFDKVYSLKQMLDEPVREPIWLIDGLIGVGDAVTVYGSWGSGKSYLLVYLALCLGSGRDWLGRRVRPSKVLYLDKEMPFSVANYRANMLINGQTNLYSDKFDYVTQPHQMVTAMMGQQLAAYAREYDVIIIDSLRSFLTGSENVAQDVRGFWNALLPLKRTGKTVILTHHMNKDNPNMSMNLANRASGSTDVCAGSDTVIAIEKIIDRSNLMTSKITQIKGRWDSKLPPFIAKAEWISKEWSRYSLGSANVF